MRRINSPSKKPVSGCSGGLRPPKSFGRSTAGAHRAPLQIVFQLVVSVLFLIVVAASPLSAAVIGTNSPAKPLTAERIAALPAKVRPAWQKYLERSDRQRRADQAFLQAEMHKNGMKESIVPPTGRWMRALSLNQPAAAYREAEARRIADIVVSFQTPAGGWSKNMDFTQHLRAPGEGFAPNNSSRYLGDSDYDAPHDTNWNYVGTFDNNATTTQLRYLAKVISAVGSKTGAVLSRLVLARSRLHFCLSISERWLAPGLAAPRRLSRRHYLQRQRGDQRDEPAQRRCSPAPTITPSCPTARVRSQRPASNAESTAFWPRKSSRTGAARFGVSNTTRSRWNRSRPAITKCHRNARVRVTTL